MVILEGRTLVGTWDLGTDPHPVLKGRTICLGGLLVTLGQVFGSLKGRI
jgi:hypothetical protein